MGVTDRELDRVREDRVVRVPALLQPQAAARRVRRAHSDEEAGAHCVNNLMRNDSSKRCSHFVHAKVRMGVPARPRERHRGGHGQGRAG